MTRKNKTIGVLALQGDFERHEHQLRLAGARPKQVRLAEDLSDLDGLIIPGGESTTMNYLIDRFDMRRPLIEFADDKPIWGTCAGMIMLANKIENNQAGIEPLRLMDIDVVRNGYGRQIFSFTDTITVTLNGASLHLETTFIRAPRIIRCGSEVEALAVYKDSPVLVRQGRLLAGSFHAELDDDTRLLEYFLEDFFEQKRS